MHASLQQNAQVNALRVTPEKARTKNCKRCRLSLRHMSCSPRPVLCLVDALSSQRLPCWPRGGHLGTLFNCQNICVLRFRNGRHLSCCKRWCMSVTGSPRNLAQVSISPEIRITRRCRSIWGALLLRLSARVYVARPNHSVSRLGSQAVTFVRRKGTRDPQSFYIVAHDTNHRLLREPKEKDNHSNISVSAVAGNDLLPIWKRRRKTRKKTPTSRIRVTSYAAPFTPPHTSSRRIFGN